MPWPETLDNFRDEGVIEPEPRSTTSLAAGFPGSISENLSPRRRDQGMLRDDGPGPGDEFRDGSLRGRRRFDRTPARAAAAFVAGHAKRVARYVPTMACHA